MTVSRVHIPDAKLGHLIGMEYAVSPSFFFLGTNGNQFCFYFHLMLMEYELHKERNFVLFIAIP